MRYAMKKTDIEVVTFKDGHVELYWCDQVRWEEDLNFPAFHPLKSLQNLTLR